MRIFDLAWRGRHPSPQPVFKGQLYFPLNDGLIGTEVHGKLRFIHIFKLSK